MYSKIVAATVRPIYRLLQSFTQLHDQTDAMVLLIFVSLHTFPWNFKICLPCRASLGLTQRLNADQNNPKWNKNVELKRKASLPRKTANGWRVKPDQGVT